LSYQLKYIVFELNSEIASCTNLKPCLLHTIAVISTFREGFNSTDLSMIDWDHFLNDGSCQFIKIGGAYATTRATALNLDTFGDNCGFGRGRWWGVRSFACNRHRPGRFRILRSRGGSLGRAGAAWQGFEGRHRMCIWIAINVRLMVAHVYGWCIKVIITHWKIMNAKRWKGRMKALTFCMLNVGMREIRGPIASSILCLDLGSVWPCAVSKLILKRFLLVTNHSRVRYWGSVIAGSSN